MDDDTKRNISELIGRLDSSGKRKFVLQLPEGLKTKAVEIIQDLEKEGFEIIYASDPCYGACDLALKEASSCNADALIHVGHSKFYRNILENRLGIITTIQHIDILENVKKFLESTGKTVFIGGQVLGCHDIAAKNIEENVDAYVFIGSGRFHPLALRGTKPVYALDIEKRKAERLDMQKWEKRRWASIYKARDAKVFGILVSSKPGQRELLGSAEGIKKNLEAAGKKAIILIMDEITEEKLMGIKVDAFVNTACPRLLDGTFSRPVINAMDLGEVLSD
jgi:2-(3-amino-3-carboxypropyl)histidine synthase